jgi:hypothetical protein
MATSRFKARMRNRDRDRPQRCDRSTHGAKSARRLPPDHCGGYAIAGTVLALGLLSPLVGIETILNAVSRVAVGPNLGLVVAGSSGALIMPM